MATPLGHALCGIALGEVAAGDKPLCSAPWREWLVFAALAQGPDLDFLAGLLVGDFEAFHHGISHSLGAALVVALMAGLWGRTKGVGVRYALLAFLIYFGQVLVDAITIDRSLPYGVPLWWPFYDGYVYPSWQLFWDVRRTPLNWGTLWHDMLAAGRELVILGPLALAAIWRRKKRLNSKV